MDLCMIAEVWKMRGLEAILEEYIHKIEGAYLLQEDIKQE